MSQSARSDLTAALREALARIEAGQPRDRVLARFGEQAEALAPLLDTAIALRSLPLDPAPEDLAERIGTAIVAEARQASEAGRRAAARRVAPQRRALPRLWYLPLAGRSARGLATSLGALLLALAILLSGAARASADSLPGSPLYPLKRGLERVQLSLAPEARESLLAVRFAERRLSEARALESAGRSPAPALEGLVELAPWAEDLPAPAQTAIAPAAEAAGPRDRAPSRSGRDAPQAMAPAVASLVPRLGPTPALRLLPTATARNLAALPSSTPARDRIVSLAPSPLPPSPVPSSPPSATALPPPPPPPTEAARPAPTRQAEPSPEPSATPIVPPASPTPAPTEPPPAQPSPPGWSRVEARVVTNAGRLLPGAQVVVVRARDGQRVASADTAADGTCATRVPAGRYQVVALADGFAAQWFRGQPSRDTAQVLELSGDGQAVQLGFRLEPALSARPDATPLPPSPEPGPTPATRP